MSVIRGQDRLGGKPLHKKTGVGGIRRGRCLVVTNVQFNNSIGTHSSSHLPPSLRRHPKFFLPSVIFSTEPLWATLVSVLFLKETMGPNALVGAGVILMACLVAQSEQISELVGMGGREGNDTLTGAQATGAEEGAEEPFQLQETEEVDDYDFPSSVLDEMVGVTEEADSESSFHMSMVQESTVPGGVYREGPAFAGKEGNLGNNENDIPAAAPVGWFESYGSTRS